MAREYTHIELHPDGRVDPSKTRIKCEGGCGTELLMNDAHSAVIVSYAMRTMPEGVALPSFQCEEKQHFCCSAECMITAVNTCMREHLLPVHNAHVAQVAALQAGK